MIKFDEKIEYYNANDRDKNTGDCVKRSLSLAYNMPYKDVSKELNGIKNSIRASAFNSTGVWTRFLEYHGYIDKTDFAFSENSGKYTVVEFADSHVDGIYIILCGKNKDISTHMVCIIDGTIYDSWNSSNWYVQEVYTISGEKASIGDKSSEDFSKNLYNDALELCKSEINKWSKKYNLLDYVLLDQCEYFGYAENTVLKIAVNYQYNKENILEDFDNAILQKFKFPKNFDIIIKFSPRMTDDEKSAHMINAVKEQVRSNLYHFKYQFNAIRKQMDAINNVEFKVKNPNIYYHDRKAFNRLPAWSMPYITEFNSENEYSDYGDTRPHNEYEITMVLPSSIASEINDKANNLIYNSDTYDPNTDIMILELYQRDIHDYNNLPEIIKMLKYLQSSVDYFCDYVYNSDTAGVDIYVYKKDSNKAAEFIYQD